MIKSYSLVRFSRQVQLFKYRNRYRPGGAIIKASGINCALAGNRNNGTELPKQAAPFSNGISHLYVCTAFLLHNRWSVKKQKKNGSAKKNDELNNVCKVELLMLFYFIQIN